MGVLKHWFICTTSDDEMKETSAYAIEDDTYGIDDFNDAANIDDGMQNE